MIEEERSKKLQEQASKRIEKQEKAKASKADSLKKRGAVCLLFLFYARRRAPILPGLTGGLSLVSFSSSFVGGFDAVGRTWGGGAHTGCSTHHLAAARTICMHT